MKQVIILAAVGLLVGLGGGTGIAIMTAPGVAADSAHADSAAAHDDEPQTVVDASHVAGDTATDSAHGTTAAPADSQATSPATTAASPVAEPATHNEAPAPVKHAPSGQAPDSAATVQLRRISRTFANMAARDAAKVLQLMDDQDVRAILGSLTEKQAAAILSAFPAERAASISTASLSASRSRIP